MVNGRGSDEPPSKRTRVSRACDQCRSNREKCDGSRPECSTCSSQQRPCSYDEQPKKRGIQPKYIRTLELALAWTCQNFPEVESVLSGGLPNEHSTAQRLIGGKDAVACEELHQAWRGSLINQQLDQILSGATVDKSGPLIADGSQNGAAYAEEAQAQAPQQSHVILTPIEDVVAQNAAPVSTDDAFEGSPSQPRRLTLPDNAWILLEWYWSLTFSWSPMLEKASVLKLMYSYPIETDDVDAMTSGEHAELWSIMALAGSQMADDQNNNEAHRSREVAESLIPTGNASYKVPHIRAMILLTMLDAQEGRMLAAWLRIGTVVSLLLLFKLIETLDVHTRFCRNVHLVAFVVERALASYMKAPAHFTDEYINSVGFVSEDGLEEWMPFSDPLQTSSSAGMGRTPTRAFSTLNNLVRMCMQSTGTGTETPAIISHTDRAIVFSLLRNACTRGSRIQPSVVLASGNGEHLNMESDLQPVFDIPAPVHGGPELNLNAPNAFIGGQNSTEMHAFMSIPNEMNAFPHINNTGLTPVLDVDAPLASANVPRHDGTMESVSGEDDILAGNPSIFEEFDAMLEHHDTDYQPQFMQNLGFQPDLDLAEFFGSDYQHSNPIQSYINSAPYNNGQNI